MKAEEIFRVYSNLITLTKQEFEKVMLPLYGNDEHYVNGIWEQFLRGPISFCASRNPIEPGLALMEHCINRRRNPDE